MRKKIYLLSVLLLVAGLSNTWASDIVDILKTESEEEQPMQEVYDFLKKCGHYFIATADGDQPRVRPFGTAAIFEGKLYIQTGKKKNVSRQMRANPKIEICALDLPAGKWLRIAATVVTDDRREAKQHMLDQHPELKSTYSADDDNTHVLYLKEVTATFSSFTGEPKEVKF
ncbi:MAG: pyridoxamine 5'-phosphate oxidase family protein [Tannerellaceae bacterium]|nr:pyridoxamine 5'-phosphate oxidase family protein [Tannerellaceae bacterium]